MGGVEAAEKVVFIYTRTGSLLLKVRYDGAALEGMVSLFIKRWSWPTGLDWCSHRRLTNKERLSMIYETELQGSKSRGVKVGTQVGLGRTEQSVQGKLYDLIRLSTTLTTYREAIDVAHKS